VGDQLLLEAGVQLQPMRNLVDERVDLRLVDQQRGHRPQPALLLVRGEEERPEAAGTLGSASEQRRPRQVGSGVCLLRRERARQLGDGDGARTRLACGCGFLVPQVLHAGLREERRCVEAGCVEQIAQRVHEPHDGGREPKPSRRLVLVRARAAAVSAAGATAAA
jgi:hypothetical protein